MIPADTNSPKACRKHSTAMVACWWPEQRAQAISGMLPISMPYHFMTALGGM